jgi:predicted enzyme related to lactoylglutathione lyase
MVNTFKLKKIGEILVERGNLNPSDLSFVLAIIESTGERFGKICLVNALVSEEALAKALAEQFGMEYIDLKGFNMDEAMLDIFPHVLPQDTIYKYHFVPLESHGDSLVVAVDDPTNIFKLDELEFFLNKQLIFKLATESAIESVLRKEEGPGWLLKGASEFPSKVGSCGVKIPATSFEKSVFFYRDFLGLGIRRQSKDIVVFDHGLVLVNGQYAAKFPDDIYLRTLIYIQVPDIEELFLRAIKQNVRIVSRLAPWNESGKLFFRCLDPDGNVVEAIPDDGF